MSPAYHDKTQTIPCDRTAECSNQPCQVLRWIVAGNRKDESSGLNTDAMQYTIIRARSQQVISPGRNKSEARMGNAQVAGESIARKR